MAVSRAYLWILVIFIFPKPNWGLLSDFKICGDSECERMISRVRATRNHKGQDCRFLNFKKGDDISVYHKLTGKRDDLWAGSIDKQFGYFPKDAVKVDEMFTVTEEVIATKDHDFFCIDAYGSLIEIDVSMSNEEEERIVSETLVTATSDEAQTASENVLVPKGSSDGAERDSSTEQAERETVITDSEQATVSSHEKGTGTSETSQAGVPSGISEDTREPSLSEPPGGSSWLGSPVTDWLGFSGGEDGTGDTGDVDGVGEQPKESFRKRKLSIDLEENHLQVETKTTVFGWLGEGLTSTLGLGGAAPEPAVSGSETEIEEEKPTQSSSWLDMGIDVLGFGQSNEDKERGPVDGHMKRNHDPESREPSSVQPSQPHSTEGEDQRGLRASQALEETLTDSQIRQDKDENWYGSIYNNIASLYGNTPEVDNEPEATIREIADHESAEREGTEREAAEREAAERKAAEIEVAKQEDTEKEEAAEREAAEREAVEREAVEREAAEREAAEREAAEREAAEREAVEREAAEREAAEREATERETAEREAAEREATEREAAEREAAEREAAEREATEREAAEREAVEREAEEREAAEREAAKPKAAERDAADREAAEREVAEREATKKEAVVREAAEREATEREAAKKGAAEREASEREAAEKEATKREAAEREAAERKAAEREAAEREAAEMEAAEIEATERQAAKQEAAERESSEREAAEREAAKQEAAEKEAAEKEAAEREATKREAAEREAAERQAAEREAAERKAAEREATKREAAEREAAEKEAAEREATKQEAAKREAAEREATERKAAEKEAAEREAMKREAAEREAAKRQAAEREAAERKAAEREAAEREAAKREAAEREAAKQEAAEKEAAEREAAEREAAEREAAKREAAEMEAAEREAAEREAAEREAAEREAAKREAEEREAAKQEAAKREAAEREAAKREAAEREAAKREAAEREAAKQEAAKREAAEREAVEREAAEREAAKREAAEREAAEREVAEREAAERAAAEREAAEREAAKREAAEREAAKRAVAEREADEREAAKREAAKIEVAEREAAEKKAAKQEAAEKEAVEREAAGLEAAKEEAAETEASGGDGDSEGTLGFFGKALGYFTPSSTTQDSRQQIEDEVEEQQGVPLEVNHTHHLPPQAHTEDHPVKAPALLRQYKTLQEYVTAEEINTLLDMLGKPKLQWLDYRLGSSGDPNEDVSNDLSIMSDLESLLQQHMETLSVPRQTPRGSSEDVEEARKHSALRKLDTLVSTLKNKLNSSVSVKDNPGRTKDLGYVRSFVLDITAVGLSHTLTAVVLLKQLIVQVVSSLPDEIRPGPDLYGVQWEAVMFTVLIGLATVLIFTCRIYQSLSSRLAVRRQKKLGQQVSLLLNEKCKSLQALTDCQLEYDKLEKSLRDSGVLEANERREKLEAETRRLEQSNSDLEAKLKQRKEDMETQRTMRMEQEQKLAEMEETVKSLEEDIKECEAQEEQAQMSLRIYEMNSDRLDGNLETAREENALMQESNAQLLQQMQGWGERISELEEEKERSESSYTAMLQDLTHKEECFKTLTDRLLQMKVWDWDLEDEASGQDRNGNQNGDRRDNNHHQKVQKLIYAAKLNAELKSVDEDKDRVFARFADEIKAKEELTEGIRQMEVEQESLQAETESYTDQIQRMQQKLHIMTEMYQENELKLHRMLTVEERGRLQKEEKLTKADRNITQAVEELTTYRQRYQDLEDDLQKTKQAYQGQITAHEKKAHNNWLAARGADRDLADTRRENALLRQKLTDMQFKLEVVEKDPYALDNLPRPMPYRGERSPYGPSPLSRPASETRAFLSPPTLMDGPPPRLSPQFPPFGPGGRGYMYPDPGPPFRRPPPGALGPLPQPGHPPLGPLPPRGQGPGDHPSFGPPSDMADPSFPGNRLGPGEPDIREGAPSERRSPPDADMRMGHPPLGPPLGHPGMGPPGPLLGQRGPPFMGPVPPPGGPLPPMDPRDPHFPRRGPYGPPDFYPPRGPGGHPMGMRGPPPSGMFPRYPPPPHMGYPPMRPPLDGLPPGPPLRPSPPTTQQPPDQAPSPHDVI
ncbi:cTAGE family member 5 isoform X2 [Osmerus eperlanus]|uniref:cTAGE family member 5 isoform X2 n=1 Tax=Osmerus eperlanus TaxID=29151 RepID=UPI002E11DB27